MWNVGRVLATMAAISYIYCLWCPWVIFRGYTFGTSPSGYPMQQWYTLPLGPGDVAPLMGQVLAGAFAVALLPLSLLMWQQTFPFLAYIAAYAYVSLMGIIGIVEPGVPLGSGNPDTFVELLPWNGPKYVSGNPVQWLPGAYLFIASICAIVLSLAPLVVGRLILREAIRAPVPGASQDRPPNATSSSRALLIGIALWALGALALPWRAGGCIQLPLVAQHCEPGGLGDALQRGLSGDPALLNPRFGMYALPALLIYLALLALAGLWRRVPLRLLGAWVGLWLAGSAVAFAFALRGLLLAMPVTFGPGLFVALAGLCVAACGLAWLFSTAPSVIEAPDQVVLG